LNEIYLFKNVNSQYTEKNCNLTFLQFYSTILTILCEIWITDSIYYFTIKISILTIFFEILSWLERVLRIFIFVYSVFSPWLSWSLYLRLVVSIYHCLSFSRDQSGWLCFLLDRVVQYSTLEPRYIGQLLNIPYNSSGQH